MKQLVIVLLSVCIFSCSRHSELPEGILKPDKMQEIFWDFIRADVYATDFIKRDSVTNPEVENLKLQEKVFKIHHTTRDQFYKSYTWYSNHKEVMTKMMDSLIAKQQRLEKKIPAIK
ncbi:MAG: DUF4296 domain-containing protein [Ferruginibacter sp.]